MSTAQITITPQAPPPAYTPEPAPSITPMHMIDLALRQNEGVDKLIKLWEFQKDFEAHQAKKSYNAAFTAFKVNAPTIIKDGKVDYEPKAGNGPNVKYDYATLYTVCEAIIPALAAQGITHRWVTSDQKDNQITVTCILTHVDGHTESATLRGPLDTSGGKDAIKSIASSKSYLERYTLLAVTGMTAKGHDDDGGIPEEAPTAAPDPIMSAKTIPELQEAFMRLYSAAKKDGNAEACKAIGAAKDKRKKELENGK